MSLKITEIHVEAITTGFLQQHSNQFQIDTVALKRYWTPEIILPDLGTCWFSLCVFGKFNTLLMPHLLTQYDIQ